MRKFLLSLCPLLLLFVASCGGGDTTPSLPPAGAGSSEPPLAASATLTGRILFEGTAPTPRGIVMSSDPLCANPNAVEQAIVVNDGGLQNVIIYLSSGMAGRNFPVPSEEVVISQNGCIYEPHVQTAQVNQTIRVRNGDNTLHNIHARQGDTTLFNFSQLQNVENTRTFDAEQIVSVNCDVHRWMNAYIGVFSHPFHTVSGSTGTFELPIPAGTYEVTAWHERFGTQTQTIEVTEGGTVDLNFTFRDTGA